MIISNSLRDWQYYVDTTCKLIQAGATELSLRHNLIQIGPTGTQLLCEFLEQSENYKLKSLDLGYNKITYIGAKYLSSLLSSNNTISHLDLEGNQLAEGVPLLATALRNNSTLSWLSLANNEITPRGAIALADSIRHHPSLTHLDLSNNSMGVSGIEAIAAALPHNTVLRSLHLTGNGGGFPAAVALLAALAQPHTLTAEHLRLAHIHTLPSHPSPNTALLDLRILDPLDAESALASCQGPQVLAAIAECLHRNRMLAARGHRGGGPDTGTMSRPAFINTANVAISEESSTKRDEFDLESWLCKLNINNPDAVASRFKDESIDLEILLTLSEDDLKELGILSLGDRSAGKIVVHSHQKTNNLRD